MLCNNCYGEWIWNEQEGRPVCSRCGKVDTREGDWAGKEYPRLEEMKGIPLSITEDPPKLPPTLQLIALLGYLASWGLKYLTTDEDPS